MERLGAIEVKDGNMRWRCHFCTKMNFTKLIVKTETYCCKHCHKVSKFTFEFHLPEDAKKENKT